MAAAAARDAVGRCPEASWRDDLNETPEDRYEALMDRLRDGHLLNEEEMSELRELRLKILLQKLEQGHLLSESEKRDVRRLR